MTKGKSGNGRSKPSKDRVTEALNQAARDAIETHRQAGLPLVFWKDGQIVLVSPDELDSPKPRRKPRPGEE